jgi:hypothetical protein
MPDITMCQDEECPRRIDCYRYVAVASERQSYFVESPREGDECNYFWRLGQRAALCLTESTDVDMENT